MAFRTPLKLIINASGSNISFQNCTAAEITQVTTEMIRQYGANPSATISVGSGNMGTITDTRLEVGAVGNDATNFDTQGETADVSTETVSYNKLVGAFHGVSAPSFSRGTEISNSTNTAFSFPCYMDATSTAESSIRQFNLDDMLDTFWHPTATRLAAGGAGADAAGTYTINSATSLSNHTRVSSTPIFTDTRATASDYTAAGVPEAADQQDVVLNYYLYRRNSASAAAMPYLVGFAKGVSIPQLIPHATLSSQLKAIARYGAINEASYRIQYRFGTGTGSSFTTRATAIDTKLNSSAYLTLQVGDDYRSQEVPAGSAATISTYNFGIKIS
jgi:hypothetical protein